MHKHTAWPLACSAAAKIANGAESLITAHLDLQTICPGGAGFGTHNGWQPRFHALAALADSCRRPVPGPASGGFLTATRESRWALRGEADDRGAVPLRIRQLALEAGKLLVHVEAGGGGGRGEPGGLQPGRLDGEPGGLLPGRLDGRTGAALLTLLQALLTALLVALAGALVLLPSLERGEERSGDQ
jgi:hypothetical protein